MTGLQIRSKRRTFSKKEGLSYLSIPRVPKLLHGQYDCSTELSRTDAVVIASSLVSNALVFLSIGMKGPLQIGTVKLDG